jgi:hypothetical protein
MSRIDLNTVLTPDITLLNQLAPRSIYGCKAHLVLSAIAPNGKREDVRVTQDIDPQRLAFLCQCSVRMSRGVVNDELHINYHSDDCSAYVGMGDVMNELTEEGYTDVRYSDDGILLMLTECAVRRLVRQGVLQTKGA